MLNDHHSVILSNDGTVHSCGSNTRGQVGNGEITNTVSTFCHVRLKSRIISTAIGYKHTLAVSEFGKLWGWGDNSFLQLGIDYQFLQNTSTPVHINVTNLNRLCHVNDHDSLSISNDNTTVYFISAAAGSNSSYVIDNERKVWCFGSNIHYQLGLQEHSLNELVIPISQLLPVTPAIVKSLQEEKCVSIPTCNEYLDDVVSIATGVSHVICLDSKGKVKVFGTGRNGELGLGDVEVSKIPTVNEQLPHKIVQISSGNSHNLVISSDNVVWGFGANWAKQLTFDESKTTFKIPSALGLPNNIVKVWCSSVSSYAKDVNGNMWVFGDNEFGQLAIDTNETSINLKINTLLSNMEIIPVGLHLFTINPITNDIFSCGFNNNGQLGINNINTNFSKSLQRVAPFKISLPTSTKSARSSPKVIVDY